MNLIINVLMMFIKILMKVISIVLIITIEIVVYAAAAIDGVAAFAVACSPGHI